MKLVLHFLVALLLGASAYAVESAPQETLDGPPLVTAKAWAITDGRTGKFLWGSAADEPQKTASTTKIMCAYVVLQLAGKDPAVLDEKVTFSKLADQTPGSTAGIQAGEQLSVSDVLYGLLLPSGNDAGNALAEHFNDRLPLPDASSPKELSSPHYATRCNFVAEMNRTAVAMGLTTTQYRIPFGDGGTAADRTTTARELLIVTRAALENPLFRKIVQTTRFVAHAQTPAGTKREVTWENSNKLLAMGNYDGVKTGGTPSAGSCLVASGRRGSSHLLVTVIGSTSDEGRYVDTRNLFRWAWREIEKKEPPK